MIDKIWKYFVNVYHMITITIEAPQVQSLISTAQAFAIESKWNYTIFYIVYHMYGFQRLKITLKSLAYCWHIFSIFFAAYKVGARIVMSTA